MDSERLRPRPSQDARCPYCHDVLLEPTAELIRCEGCGTDHHAACIAELGRCTVMGCEQPLILEDLPEPDRAQDSAQARLIRRRIRDRVKSFVRTHAKRPASYGQADPRDVPPLSPNSPRPVRTPPITQTGREVMATLLLIASLPLAVLLVYGLAVLVSHLTGP